jgi:hypothetical protein
LRFNRRRRHFVRGLPFKCKSEHNSQWAGIYFVQEKSGNVHIIAGLLIKCNSLLSLPIKVQQSTVNGTTCDIGENGTVRSKPGAGNRG